MKHQKLRVFFLIKLGKKCLLLKVPEKVAWVVGL